MPMIDDAAAAFRRADARYTVDRTDRLAKFNVTEDMGEGNMVMHAEHIRHDDATTLRDQLGGAAGVTAVLQEMISVRVLTVAIANCGAPIDRAKALADKLLPAIILLLESDALGGGDAVLLAPEDGHG